MLTVFCVPSMGTEMLRWSRGKRNSCRKYRNIAVGPLFPNPALGSTISGFYSLRRNLWQTDKSSCICWQIEDYSQVRYLNPTSGGRKTALICQASGINAGQIPSVDRNAHALRTQTFQWKVLLSFIQNKYMTSTDKERLHRFLLYIRYREDIP